MSAVDQWRRMVEEEHAQSERVREQGRQRPPEDHWGPYAAQFALDPHRTDDPLLERLALGLAAEHTLLDVGAGAGRYALPLALRCRRVVAVEPSSSMVAVLRRQASAFGVQNVSVVESSWEEAQVEVADAVICVHVLYAVRDIAPFVRKLEAHARGCVMVVLYPLSPQAHIFPLWERVHGERRLSLPRLPEFVEVLGELGVTGRLDRLPPQPPRSFASREEALEQTTRRLYLDPDGPKYRLLEEALDELLEERDGAYRIRGAPQLEPVVAWWRPTGP